VDSTRSSKFVISQTNGVVNNYFKLKIKENTSVHFFYVEEYGGIELDLSESIENKVVFWYKHPRIFPKNGLKQLTLQIENDCEDVIEEFKLNLVTPETASNTSACISGSTTEASIKVTGPNGGQTFSTGQNMSITWTSTGMSSATNLRIELTNASNTTVASIINSTPNDGSHSWTIPSTITTGSYKIKISRADSGSPEVFSDATFTINNLLTSTKNISIKSIRVYPNIIGDVLKNRNN
jgi:hypothetical protein